MIDTVVNMNQVLLENLSPSRDYFCFVQSICAEDTISIWSVEHHFATQCGAATLPYSEDFSYEIFPTNCWTRKGGAAEDIFNGQNLSNVSSNYWMRSTNSNSHYCASLLLGRNMGNHWLLTPEIDITQPAAMEFEIALSYYGSSGMNVDFETDDYDDDLFMVAISEDGGLTWQRSNALVWNHDGTGEYNFKLLNISPAKVTVDMTKYAGKQVKVAFYGESTASNGSAIQVMVSNLTITPVATKAVTDNICEGNGTHYTYGFNIVTDDLKSENAPYTYSEIRGDTLVTLTLEVQPSAKTTIEHTICDGDTYNDHGFNETASGIYYQRHTAANECDSVVTLILTVNPTYDITESIAIPEEELPYLWNGQTLTEEGIYHHNGSTKDDCDSIVHLNFAVTTVGLTIAKVETFQIVPNPMKAGESAHITTHFTEMERDRKSFV